MASKIPNAALKHFFQGDINWNTDVIRVMLMLSSHVPDIDADEFVSDISADEISTAGYQRETFGNPSVVQDNTNNRGDARGDDTTDFGSPAAGETAGGAWLYKQVGGDDSTEGDDILICFIDTDDVALNGTAVTVDWIETQTIMRMAQA